MTSNFLNRKFQSYNQAMDNVLMHNDSIAEAQRMQDTLKTLLEGIARGDQQAFAAFYDATSARAFGVIRRIVRTGLLAEDVMEDVYLQVWQQAGRYDTARGAPLAWLLMLCRSRALDYLRRRDPAQLHQSPDELRPEIYQIEQTPCDILVELDRQYAVHRALEHLSTQERQYISLAFFRGMSHQEISDYTHTPLGTVKTIIRKAMNTMKQQLGGQV